MAHFEKVLGTKFKFGLDKESIASRLESLAKGIRAERIYPQAIEHSITNVTDDFEMVTLKLTFAEPAKDEE